MIGNTTASTMHSLTDTKIEVSVKVENYESGQINQWTTDKFQDKLIMMRDAMNIYEQNEFQDLGPDEDPFHDKAEPILLGQGICPLEALAYLMDNPQEIPIIATNYQIYG